MTKMDCLYHLISLCLGGFVADKNMQNKANLRRAKMDVNIYSAKDYGNGTTFALSENKPNQSQFPKS
jgi:hypothetical protein